MRRSFGPACALGLPAAAVLAVNNYRDLETDKRNGKITLAVRLGRKVSQVEYVLLMMLPFVLLANLSIWLPLAFAAMGLFPVSSVHHRTAGPRL